MVAEPCRAAARSPPLKSVLGYSSPLPQFSRNLICISRQYLLNGVSRNRKPQPGKWKSRNQALLSTFTADAWLPAKARYGVMQMPLFFFIRSQNITALVKRHLQDRVHSSEEWQQICCTTKRGGRYGGTLTGSRCQRYLISVTPQP